MRYEREHQPLDSMGRLVLPSADALRDNEPVVMLSEYNLPDEGFTGTYRWQLIRVVRDDRLYDFPRRLGPSDSFTASPFLWICDGDEDTVAQMIDLADRERDRDGIKQTLAEEAGERSMFDRYVELEEQKHTLIKRNYRTLRADFGLRTV